MTSTLQIRTDNLWRDIYALRYRLTAAIARKNIRETDQKIRELGK